MKPDDWVESCAVCGQPTIVSKFAIIFSKDERRTLFDKIECFINWMTDAGYLIQDKP